MDQHRIKFMCIKCRSIPYVELDTIEHHLYKLGFVPNYWFQDIHGETSVDDNTYLRVDDSYKYLNKDHECSYIEMVIDAMALDFYQ